MSFSSVALGLATFQALMVSRNLSLFRPPEKLLGEAEFTEGLSVLIPARDEEQNLPALLDSLAAQECCHFQVIVLDDNSQDGTRRVAEAYAQKDARFRVHSAPPLPPGWAGKQHACHQLSLLADYDHWLFLDADVVLTDPRALARIAFHLQKSPSAMLSSIPRQITESWAEQVIIPLIHLVLLGFLPFWEMRRNRMPALGAACGQMVAVKRDAYLATHGHWAVKHRLHDATALAVNLRKGGYLTDLFDSTDLATCRMYNTAGEVFLGFAKNATEGMAQPLILPIWTVLLLGANVLPWLCGLFAPLNWQAYTAQALTALVYLALMWRYRQSFLGVLTRPAGVLLFVAIQWVALVGKWLGWKASWKGRVYQRLYN